MGNFTTSKAVSVRNFDFMKFVGILVMFLGLSVSEGWGATITPIRTDVSGFTSWTDNAVSGTTYLQLITGTSSTVTPSMDFSTYSSKSLDFTARTYGGGNTAQSTITVSISINNGSSWTILGTRVPTSASLLSQTTFDLTSYNSTQVKIKFETLGASASKGVGIDDITISGSPLPTKLAITSISPTSPIAGSTFNVTVQAQDGSSVAGNVSANTAISLSNTGGGTIGGTTTGTIAAGASSVTINGVTLSSSGAGVTLTATRTSGDVLTTGTSSSFNVLASTPTVASAVTAGIRTTTTVPLSWTSGSGTARIVVARLNSTAVVAPTAGTAYACNSADFTDALNSTTGTNNKVVYNGTGNSVVVSGLTAATAYNFDVYEFNGTTGTYNYSAAASTGSTSTLSAEPTAQPTSLTFTSISATGMTIGCTAGTGGSNRIFVVKAGSAVDFAPTDGTAYTANLNFSNGTGLGTNSDNKVVAVTSASAVVTGLTANTTYYVAVYELNGSSTTINYLTSSPLTGSMTTLGTTASAVTVNSKTASTMNLSWTNGTGSGVIVVGRATSNTLVTPSNGTNYTVNSADITDVLNSTTGTGNVVLYKGTGTSVSIAGLSAATQYQFYVYTYNSANYYASAASSSAIYTLAAEPAIQASNVTFSSVTATGMTINFTKGDAANTGRLVLMKAGSAVDSNPVDGTGYTVNSTFGSGTPVVGTGNYAVYGGTGTSVSVTGLSANTTYYVAVYEFNGTITGTTTNFLTSTPATGSQITLVTAPSAPTNLTFSNVGYNGFNSSFTAPGATPDGYLVMRRAAAITGTPVGGTTYTAGQSIGAAANEIIYVGAAPWSSYSQIGLTDNTTYYYAVYSYSGAGSQINYSSVLNGSQTTSGIDAPVASNASTISSTGITANWNTLSGATGYKLDVSTYSAFGTNTPASMTEGFESGLSGSYTSSTLTLGSGDWVFANSGLAVSGTGNFNSGTTSCQLKASSGIATSPSKASISTVTFYAKSPNGATTIDIKKIVNGGSAALVETKNLTSSWAQYTVTVNENSSDVKISFVNGSSYILIDDVVINHSNFTASLLSSYNNLSVSGTSQSVTGLSPNTTYYYRVRAVGSNSTSVSSNVISVTTSQVSTPTAIDATNVTSTTFRANTNSVSDATGYVIDVATDLAFNNIVSFYTGMSMSGTFHNITGLSPNTTYYYRVRATSPNSTSANSNVISVTTLASYSISVSSSDGAKGSVSGGGAKDAGASVSLTATPASGSYRFVNWTENGTFVSKNNPYTFTASAAKTLVANFDDMAAPIAVTGTTNASTYAACTTCDVTVSAGAQLTVDESKSFNSVTVAAGGKLTLSDGVTLTAPVNLQSTADGTATFVDESTGTPQNISGSVQQYLATTRNWYVSSPVSNANAPTGYTYYRRNEPAVGWTPVSVGTGLVAGVGYIALPNSTGPITFSTESGGRLNTGNIDISLTWQGATSKGYNLIGNPYPSHLTWNKAFTDANAAKIEPTIWYRTNSGSTNSSGWSFKTYNAFTGIGVPLGTTGIIPPMQAFWVLAKADGQTIQFTNSMRSHQTSNPLKVKTSETSGENVLLRLQVANTVATDETVLLFNENASDGYDVFDSPKMLNNDSNVPDIFTIVDSKKLVINGMQLLKYDVEIPIGFITNKTADFKISATEMLNFDPTARVVLKDANSKIEYDLTAGNSFEFSSGPVNTLNRFSIIFRTAGTTTSMNNNAQSRRNVYVNANKELVISAPVKATYGVYNALGQKLTDGVIGSGSAIVRGLQEAGIIIVKITDNGKTTSDRVLMK